MRAALTVSVTEPNDDYWSQVEALWDMPPGDSWFEQVGTVQQWCTLFAEKLQTRGVRWFCGEQLVGTALLTTRQGKRGPIPVRQVVVNLVPGYGFLPEHQRLMSAPGWLPSVAEGLLDLARLEGFDELHLCGFDEASCHAVILASRLDASSTGYFSDSPYVDLEALRTSGSAFVESRPASVRARIRRSMREYTARYGSLQLEAASTPDERAAVRRELVQLHQQSWNARDEPGAFSSDTVHMFLDATERTAELADTLRWVRVRSGATTIAALIYAVHRRRVLFLQSGLRYDDSPHCRPGLVAHSMAIDWFAADGALEYDFLGGERTTPRYKTELSDLSRSLGFLTIPLPTPRTRIVTVLRHLRNELRARLRAAPVATP